MPRNRKKQNITFFNVDVNDYGLISKKNLDTNNKGEITFVNKRQFLSAEKNISETFFNIDVNNYGLISKKNLKNNNPPQITKINNIIPVKNFIEYNNNNKFLYPNSKMIN